MNLISRRGLLERIRRNKASRENLVTQNLAEEIAFQIRATRDAKGWTQEELAREVGMTQNNLSRLENPDYGKHTLSSLKRVASALDVALVVRLVPFSQYIDWLSGTPHWDRGLRPEALAVPSFEKEEAATRSGASVTELIIDSPVAIYSGATFALAGSKNFVVTTAVAAPQKTAPLPVSGAVIPSTPRYAS